MSSLYKFHSFSLGLLLTALLALNAPENIAKFASTLIPVQERTCDLAGKVIHVSDGDTIKVLDAQNVQHKVRLAGIDAPEKRQAFGNVAKEYLSNSVKLKNVCVTWDKKGRYGRIIGTVYADGKDVNLDLLAQGLAWHYKKYQDEQSLRGKQKYAAAEINAQQDERGLWQDENALAPWEWRSQKKLAYVQRNALPQPP